MTTNGRDPVLASVAAYSNDPEGYEQSYRQHRLELPQRFSSLLQKPSNILDLGCGPGRDLDIFAGDGHTVTGVDLNEKFAVMASTRHHVLHADMRQLSTLFADSTFDGVWAQASLVHLSSDEVSRVIADCYHLLRRHGIFYTCVPTVGESGWKSEPDGTRWYTVWPGESFLAEIENAGFLLTDYTEGPYIEVWARKP